MALLKVQQMPKQLRAQMKEPRRSIRLELLHPQHHLPGIARSILVIETGSLSRSHLLPASNDATSQLSQARYYWRLALALASASDGLADRTRISPALIQPRSPSNSSTLRLVRA